MSEDPQNQTYRIRATDCDYFFRRSAEVENEVIIAQFVEAGVLTYLALTRSDWPVVREALDRFWEEESLQSVVDASVMKLLEGGPATQE